MEYSPLAFSNPAIEERFQRHLNTRYAQVGTLYMVNNLVIAAASATRVLLHPALQRDWVPAALCVGFLAFSALMAYAIQVFRANVRERHLQAVLACGRVGITVLGVGIRPYFMKLWDLDRVKGPLRYIQIYVVGANGCSVLLNLFGARLMFMPDLATTASMLLIHVSWNKPYCQYLASATAHMAEDMAGLSRITRAVTRLTSDITGVGGRALFTAGIPCELNLAMIQALASLVGVVGVLLLEMLGAQALLVVPEPAPAGVREVADRARSGLAHVHGPSVCPRVRLLARVGGDRPGQLLDALIGTGEDGVTWKGKMA
eukprot:jgi/Botrbrau1/20587/Bobra.113_1s0013.1